ncbi:shikimate dehydrogenase [soil metagenome]
MAADGRFAVVGNPIGHSRSPAIHALFAEGTGISLIYERILAPADEFAPTVRAFFARGGRGLNVTVPFKLEAAALAVRLTPRASSAGAVNTLWMADGELHGDNTDGIGLVRDLVDNLEVTLAGARVLLVGAGGSARGVLRPLLDANPAELVVVNRTRATAESLVESARPNVNPPTLLSACNFMDVPEAFDVVINATSAGFSGDIPPLPPHAFAFGSIAYDLMYGSKPTLFMDYALTLGATRIADGLGMLVEQAAESFQIWHGRKPETPGVIAEMRHRLRAEAHQAL